MGWEEKQSALTVCVMSCLLEHGVLREYFRKSRESCGMPTPGWMFPLMGGDGFSGDGTDAFDYGWSALCRKCLDTTDIGF